MAYQIIDTGASIRFTNEYGFFFLMKHDIKAICSVRDDMIKIDTGCCFNSHFIYASTVTEPLNSGAEHLSLILNNWITEFLNGYPEPYGGPHE